MAYTNILLDNYSKKIKNILFPIVFLGIFIFILVLTRNILLSIDLFIPIVLSSLLTQGLIKLLFGNSNLIIAITPLIIAVLNFSLLLHLYRTAIFEGSFKKALEVKICARTRSHFNNFCYVFYHCTPLKFSLYKRSDYLVLQPLS